VYNFVSGCCCTSYILPVLLAGHQLVPPQLLRAGDYSSSGSFTLKLLLLRLLQIIISRLLSHCCCASVPGHLPAHLLVVLLLLLLLQIIISWFLSPIAAALVCLAIFLIIRTFVLRRPNSTKIAFWVLPVLIIVTIWVVSVLAVCRCRAVHARHA
jgi:hypothetical protein